MRIAMPSLDGNVISGHFGRSPLFVVFTTTEKEITGKELRKNDGSHQHGECGHDDHVNGTGHHSHATILQVLGDVDVVIAGGMGHRVYQDLVSAGKMVLMTTAKNCADAAEAFINGTLQGSEKDFCGCNHHAKTS